jgi:hypothetical protein
MKIQIYQDKEKIRALLKKPFILYIFRHSSISRHARILKESTLRTFSGWTVGSNMVHRYVHLYNNAPVEDLLVARGLISKDGTADSVLRSKQCPNCNEPNKPDSKFCAKCRMVLTYDVYSEMIEEKQKEESELQKLREKQERDMRLMREEMENKFQQILAKIDVATLK